MPADERISVAEIKWEAAWGKLFCNADEWLHLVGQWFCNADEIKLKDLSGPI